MLLIMCRKWERQLTVKWVINSYLSLLTFKFFIHSTYACKFYFHEWRRLIRKYTVYKLGLKCIYLFDRSLMIIVLARLLLIWMVDWTNVVSSPQGLMLPSEKLKSGPTISCPADSSDMSSSPHLEESWTMKRQEGSILEERSLVSFSEYVSSSFGK